MRNILRIKLFLALLLMALAPCVNAQVAHVGDILCTSGVYVSAAEFPNSGLEAMGVIFYVDATGQHGWAIALQDEGNYFWCSNSSGPNSALPNYTSVRAAIYDLDGLFNTQVILNLDENNANIMYPAFEAVDFANGWYVPAIGQLNYLFGNLIEVNAALAVCGGNVFKMSNSWEYWSSTEANVAGSFTHVYYLESTGKIWYSQENYSKSVRAVHNF